MVAFGGLVDGRESPERVGPSSFTGIVNLLVLLVPSYGSLDICGDFVREMGTMD